MKQIPKKQFDEVVRISREYWDGAGTEPQTELLHERVNVAKEIEIECGFDWLALIDFVDSVIRPFGLLPGACNEMLISLLRALGWEVADVKVDIAD